MRVEEVKEKQDFIVSRGVTAFPAFVDWVKDKIRPGLHQPIANGILYLKGGDFDEEVRPYGKKLRLYAVSDFFREEFFETKSDTPGFLARLMIFKVCLLYFNS